MTMMRDGICNYGEGRDDLLIEYLYGEASPGDRDLFGRHLAQCAVCRAEVSALGDVRTELGEWTAPELSGQVLLRPIESERRLIPPPTRSTLGQRLSEVPLWAQTAAAILCLGVAAGFANLQVNYGTDGLSIRTGWQTNAPREVAAPSTGAVATPASATDDRWRPELEALARELRREIAARPASVASTSSDNDDEALTRKIRAAVRESEQRQQRELALRAGQIVSDVQAQRQADLVKIERNLGLIQRNTGMEVMRTQQQLNSLVQRVSQQP